MKRLNPKHGHKKLNTLTELRKAQRYEVSIEEAFSGHYGARFIAEVVRRICADVGVQLYLLGPEVAMTEHASSSGGPLETVEGAEVTLGTGSDLEDVLYERRCVYLKQGTDIENLIHEMAHVLCAKGDQLDRVNYGTFRRDFYDDFVDTHDFEIFTIEHENAACDLEMAFWRYVGWPDGGLRAEMVHSWDSYMNDDLMARLAPVWNRAIGENARDLYQRLS